MESGSEPSMGSSCDHPPTPPATPSTPITDTILKPAHRYPLRGNHLDLPTNTNVPDGIRSAAQVGEGCHTKVSGMYRPPKAPQYALAEPSRAEEASLTSVAAYFTPVVRGSMAWGRGGAGSGCEVEGRLKGG